MESTARKLNSDVPANSFAARLRQLRMQRNLSQAEMAKLAGLHFMHYGRYERGQSQPKADALQRLADALGVSGDYLLNGTGQGPVLTSFQDPDFARQLHELEKLSEHDRQIIKAVIDAFLIKRKIQELTSNA